MIRETVCRSGTTELLQKLYAFTLHGRNNNLGFVNVLRHILIGETFLSKVGRSFTLDIVIITLIVPTH